MNEYSLKLTPKGLRGWSLAFSIFLAISLLGFFSSGLEFWKEGWPRLVSSEMWQISAGVSLIMGGALIYFYLKERRAFDAFIESYREVAGFVFLSAILVVFLSDFPSRNFSYFVNGSQRLSVLILSLGSVWAFLGLSKVSDKGRIIDRIFCFELLLLLTFLLTGVFLAYCGERVLFSDDHPSFLYRLHLLREHFPDIPFYNTEWNAGYQAREFFPSGILNVFFLLSPFLYFLPSFDQLDSLYYYNFIITYVFIFVVPLSAYFAARHLKCDKPTSTVAAIFCLGPSMYYFEHLLKFGTIGFLLSASLSPLVLAMCLRFLFVERISWGYVIALLVVSFFGISWALASIIYVPVTLIGLCYLLGYAPRERLIKGVVFALLFLCLNGPWLYVFITESQVFSFVSGAELPGVENDGLKSEKVASGESEGSLVESIQNFRIILGKCNPVLFILFLPAGIYFLRSSNKREVAIITLTILWLVAVAALGDAFKRQLELVRFIIPAMFLMAIPVAGYLMEALRHSEKVLKFGSTGSQIARGLTLLVFFLSVILVPLTVASAYQNRSFEKFSMEPAELRPLVRLLKKEDIPGRVFFLGFILQEFGAKTYDSQDGGHIAPLASLSGVELYASHYYHKYWMHTDPIPEKFRKRGQEGIEEFLDLVNASHVVTFKKEWVDYCLQDSRYRQLAKYGRFRVWRRESAGLGAFLKGGGEVSRTPRSLRVNLQDLDSEGKAVIKYRYLDELVASDKRVELFPVRVSAGKSAKLSRAVREVEQLDYIGISVPDAQSKQLPLEFTIQYRAGIFSR